MGRESAREKERSGVTEVGRRRTDNNSGKIH